MTALIHAIKIAAPTSAVFHALTDIQALAAWHNGTVEGAVQPGQVMTLRPRPDMHFSWRTDRVEPNALIAQTSLDGTGSFAGRTLTFKLEPLDDGRTQIELTDNGWSADDPHLPFCNAHWGDVLHRLKAYVEQQ